MKLLIVGSTRRSDDYGTVSNWKGKTSSRDDRATVTQSKGHYSTMSCTD
jgi:hypothetical protein